MGRQEAPWRREHSSTSTGPPEVQERLQLASRSSTLPGDMAAGVVLVPWQGSQLRWRVSEARVAVVAGRRGREMVTGTRRSREWNTPDTTTFTSNTRL